MTYSLDGYVDVPARLAAFYERFPDGSIQMDPPTFIEVLGKQFVYAQARAYRTPDDPRPGVGTAWEAIPGSTPYTRGSELMNLETSCWGRAVAAVMPVGRISTTEEIALAEARRDDHHPTGDAVPTQTYRTPSGKWKDGMAAPITEPQLKKLRYEVKKHGIDEVVVDTYANENLGFGVPLEGFGQLTKGQASALIDALANGAFDKARRIERTSTPNPDDPWTVNQPA